jgi:hypothetical protein
MDICIITILTLYVTCVSSHIYTTVIIGPNAYYQIPMETNVDNIQFNIVALDNSKFSAYLLNYDNYLKDYTNKTFEKDNMLGVSCIGVVMCSRSIILDPKTDYVLLVSNDNIVRDATINYYVETIGMSSIAAWLITIGCIIFSIIVMIMIVYTCMTHGRGCKALPVDPFI